MPSVITSIQPSPFLTTVPALREPFESTVQQLPASAPEDGVDAAQPRAAGPASAGDGGVAPKAPAGEPKDGTDDASKKAIAELNKFNALELQKQIREGTIPEEILKDPRAMLALTERIQEFSRMIQMMTNMMQVEHDTLTAIIRNIKA